MAGTSKELPQVLPGLDELLYGPLPGGPQPRRSGLDLVRLFYAIDGYPELLDGVPKPDVVEVQQAGATRLRIDLIAHAERDLLHRRQADARQIA